MDIPSWLIDLAKSLGAGSAPILALMWFLQWRDNGKLRDRMFARADKDEEMFDKLSESLSNLSGVMANEFQKGSSERRIRR